MSSNDMAAAEEATKTKGDSSATLLYRIDQNPKWYLSILLGFQVIRGCYLKPLINIHRKVSISENLFVY